MGTNKPTCTCGECSTCVHREYQRQYRLRNKAKVAAKNLAWKKTPVGRANSRADRRSAYQRNREQEIEAERLRSEAEPQKAAARRMVRNAIRRGELVRQTCEECDMLGQAHHDDYSKPLEVRWLCPSHHKLHHLNVGG